MAKKIIRTGTTADPTGDSLKNAFTKVNDNFTELYNALGLDAETLNLGAFEFAGSVMTTTDSTPIVIDQAVSVTSDLTVGGDILPARNLQSTLGSPTNKFHSLYVGTGSVYIGDARLSLEGGTLNSSVGFATNNLIVGGVSLSVTNAGKLGASGGFDLTDTQIDDVLPSQTGNAGKFLTTDGANNLSWGVGGGGNANTGNFTFDQDTITNNNGLLLDTGRGRLAIGTNMEGPGVAGHFHIGFDGSNSEANANDLFLGDDYNYVKLPGSELNDDDYGVEIGTHDRDGGDSHTWRFGTDGNLTFPNGDITIGYDPYGGPAIIGAAGKSIAMIASGVGEVEGEIGSSLIWVDSITEPTKIAAVTANNPLYVGAGDVGIVTGNYGPGGYNNIWNFGADGNLTLPGDIRSEGNINIDINLSDSTLRRWTFGEDGILTLPEGGDILNSDGDSVLGGLGGGASLTDDKEIKVTVGNTDYWAIVNRANNDDDGVESSAVAYDSQGNLITLHISEVYTGNDDTNRDRLIISKFDSSATLIWQKQIQEDMDVSQAHDVCIDADDNIIVTFSFNDTVGVVKYTSLGTELWKKEYHPAVDVTITQTIDLDSYTITSGSYNGGTVDVVTLYWDYAYLGDSRGWSLQETTNAGDTWTTVAAVLGFGAYNSGAEQTQMYLAANSGVTLTNAGGYQYRVTRQGPNSNIELSGAVTDSTHTFIAAAYREDSANGAPITSIMKISNSNGALVWAKTFNIEETTFGVLPYGMEIDSNGDLVVVGGFYVGPGPCLAYVSKFNGLTGAEVWTRILSNDTSQAAGGDVTADSQGNVFVTINARINIVHEETDTLQKVAVYISKLNSSGVIQWTRRVGPGPCASVGTGIDCDSLGNVYLSALTTAQKNPNREDNNFNPGDITDTRDVLAIAKYSTSGTVLWQRYIEANGYEFVQSKNASDGVSNFYWGENSGRNLSVSTTGKLAVQVTVRKYDLDDYVWDTRYYESITFQIDQDGREMTIGSGDEKFTVKASRIPGKLITLVDEEEGNGAAAVTVGTLTEDVEVTTPTITYADAEIAQQVIKSEPYEYVFGNDGTLTIPNDGDVKLTQTQVGWFSIFGPVSDSPYNVWNRANCVDTATGDVYVTGQESSNNRAYVARYNSAGEILWSIRLNDNTWGSNTRGNAIKMNPVTGNVTVLSEFEGGENSLLIEIDPDTAQIVNSLGFKDAVTGETGNADTTPYDFDFQSDGSIVVVGRKYDERKSYSAVPQTGSTTDVLVINRADLGGDAYTNDWQIAGTDISGFSSIAFNYYSGLTGTVRQGSGATFDITIGGDGSITNPVVVANGGTNYLQGHKIKIPYTAVGGSDANSDIILTVTATTEDNVITSVAAGFFGGGAGTPGTYYAQTGTNYQTGSGLTFEFWGPRQGTDYNQWDDHSVSTVGTNYVTGDIVVIPGTQLGGLTPANDLTAVVNASAGEVFGFAEFTGTSQSSTYRISVQGSGVDFGGTGTWQLSYPAGAEAFVWTNAGLGWNKIVGSLNPNANERYYSVATGSDGSIYAAGELFTDDSTYNFQAVVSKFNNLGVHQWSRVLNTYSEHNVSAKCVAVRGTTVVVSSFDNTDYDTIITKLNTSGNIQWQRRTDSGDDSSVAIDTNGDIYAVTEANFENRYEDVIKVIRFASNGEPIWRKFFGTLGVQNSGTHEYFKNGRNITLDAEHFYVSGYTTAFDDDTDRAFLVKLPKSGDCDGYYGGWTVQTEAYNVLKVDVSEANTFTPNIRPGDFRSWEPDIESNWWDPSDGDSYYQQLDPVVDRDGGAIEFADGTRQTTSAQQIPQLKISTGADHRLTIDDMGKHIYVTNPNTRIIVPYNFDNRLPIGFTVVIINNNGVGSISIQGDGSPWGGGMDIMVPGVDLVRYWALDNPGMATLIKVEEDLWFMTGNVTPAP